jgi:predicted alpha/beta hydrolase family esterase
MRTRDADLLIIPGLGGSGPDHWQSRWQSKLPTARRVEQQDWDCPTLSAWQARLAEAIAESERPIVLIAHSLGVILVGHVLSRAGPNRVAGAFLVAPPSASAVTALAEIDPAFVPFPGTALPCPSVMVASTDDPYATVEDTAELASTWGSSFLNAGAAGHINPDSGHGPWPEGLMAFAGFLKSLNASH